METDKFEADITALLGDVAAGRARAQDRLFEAVYCELHRRAGALMRKQPDSHTLQATALVGEVYVRMFQKDGVLWKDRHHFLLAASRAMRHLLVDHARKKSAAKREGKRVPLEANQIVDQFESRAIDIEALHAALEKFSEINPEMASAVELRFFGNVSIEDTADYLNISERSFGRRWAMTKAWLFEELK
ncbi:MAG: RNA polymerase sigma factor (TIGR02999 family) [Planctomycetota bacterium]|jgi:RNA polymerase sigma factor (TIGR02999 family)